MKVIYKTSCKNKNITLQNPVKSKPIVFISDSCEKCLSKLDTCLLRNLSKSERKHISRHIDNRVI